MSSQRHTVHLIYGPTAAGKSTYARKLAANTGAVCFAIDEWMHALFGPDQPEDMTMAWVAPRVARCQQMIWATSQRILAAGRDVVLELGLLREMDRERAVSMVEQAGYAVALTFVDAELGERRRRVRERNLTRGETFSFEVTPMMFETMERIFERPSPGELIRSRIVSEMHDHG
jgi:predicted kinase